MQSLRHLRALAIATVLLAFCAGTSPALAAQRAAHHASHCARAGSFRAHHGRARMRGSAGGCARRLRLVVLPRHGVCAQAALRPTSRNLRLVRTATLCLVNRERMSHGEAPLASNLHLERAAQGHTASMASRNYFEHVGPHGETPLSRMRAAGYIYSSQVGYEVGENIGWGTLREATPQAVVAAWMASPGHRANILDPHFRDTAIGVVPHPPASLSQGQAGAIYTQDFGVIVTG